jgi:FKBP-type peptidyl-prolyl cis-trans isomerase SlyD
VICQNSAVSFQYTLTDEKGKEIGSSPEDHPLEYIHGLGKIIPGLESALEGKKVGDEILVTIEPKDAYGEKFDHLINEIPRANFGDNEKDLKVGRRFQADTDRGKVTVDIIALTDETVTVDGNHPLAGKSLTFDVRILEVREATKEEIESCSE